MSSLFNSTTLSIANSRVKTSVNAFVYGTLKKPVTAKEVKYINEFLKNPVVPAERAEFDPRINKAAREIEARLQKMNVDRAGWYALQILEAAPGIEDKLPAGALQKVADVLEPFNKDFDGDADIAIADGRYQFVSSVAQKAVVREGEMSVTMTDKIDRVVLNRWLGLPIFLAVMYAALAACSIQWARPSGCA